MSRAVSLIKTGRRVDPLRPPSGCVYPPGTAVVPTSLCIPRAASVPCLSYFSTVLSDAVKFQPCAAVSCTPILLYRSNQQQCSMVTYMTQSEQQAGAESTVAFDVEDCFALWLSNYLKQPNSLSVWWGFPSRKKYTPSSSQNQQTHEDTQDTYSFPFKKMELKAAKQVAPDYSSQNRTHVHTGFRERTSLARNNSSQNFKSLSQPKTSTSYGLQLGVTSNTNKITIITDNATNPAPPWDNAWRHQAEK